MKKHFVNLKKFAINYKKTSFIIAIVLIVSIYYTVTSLTGKTTSNQYFLGAVKTGSISSTVTGTGQISTSNQIDLKAKVTADVINIPIKEGQEVKAGTTIIQLDGRDAEIALESARIAYQKLTKPADKVTLLQAQSSYESAKDAEKKAYGDGYSSVLGAFLDAPSIINSIDSMLNSSSGFLSDQKQYSTVESQYRKTTLDDYIKAKARYEALVPSYKSFSTNSSKDDIENIVGNTYLVMREVAQVVKDAKSAADYISQNGTTQTQSGLSQAQTDISSWSLKVSTDIDALLSAKNAIASAKLDVSEKNENLIKIESGADELDIKSEALNLKQKQYNYENYFVKAPIDGIVAKINVKKGDSASGVVATLITKKQIATISLNEVDASKVKVGQKAKMTFDAVNDLTISGEVTKLDIVGTMNQGVVTYAAEITLDKQDPRVRPGMSVSAEIITDSKDNILIIPNSAIKTKGKTSYIETFDKQYPVTAKGVGITSSVAPRQQNIEIGITNDTETEVISGLNDGDIIVIRTITGTITKAPSSAPSIFGGNSNTRVGGTRVK
jgi:HlyD family secretion protein